MFHSKSALISSLKTEPKADIPARFIDANTAICYGSSQDIYTLSSGKVVEMDVRWSATVVKENGIWKVALAHVGTDFLDNPVLNGIRGATKIVGLVAAAGGLVAGLVIGWIVFRRKGL
jgi:hypothetical protein